MLFITDCFDTLKMSQEKTFDKCKYFRKTKCKYRDDELMKQLINLMEIDYYDKYLANKINELQCHYCKVFKHRQ